MAGYVLAKYRFHFKGLIMSLITLSLMFAPETVGIPRYLIISGLDNNTYFGHILPALASPIAVFMLMGFISQIPKEFLEAAKMDGASQFGIFTKIVLPLSFPLLQRYRSSPFKAYGEMSRPRPCSCKRKQ